MPSSTPFPKGGASARIRVTFEGQVGLEADGVGQWSRSIAKRRLLGLYRSGHSPDRRIGQAAQCPGLGDIPAQGSDDGSDPRLRLLNPAFVRGCLNGGDAPAQARWSHPPGELEDQRAISSSARIICEWRSIW